MKNLKAKFLPLVAGAAIFSACGDDVTKVYMENQAGVGQVARFGEMPECTAENAGEMLYAADSARVYYCADSAWATLNGRDGSDGRNGQDGEKGSGCTADSTAKGIVVVCGGDTVGTIVNGKDGSDGRDGSSCTAEVLPDGSGYRIVCGGDSVGVVLNGSDGKDGKDGADGRDGLAKVPEGNYNCSEYDCVTTAYLNPAFEYGELLDARDNKVYRTIEIGSQVWMAQNLDFYDSSDVSLEGQTACYYDSLVFCETYGRLYSWSAAMRFLSDYNNQQTEAKMIKTPHRGVCPEGWHLPSDAEWDTLGAYVDAHNGAEGVGVSLKSRYLWTGPAYSFNTAYETDLFGWAGLPGDKTSYGTIPSTGEVGFTGFDRQLGNFGYWWSSTEELETAAGSWAVLTNLFARVHSMKGTGLSVRCVKD